MKLKNKFVILTAAYNCQNYIQKNLRSSFDQDYDDLGIIIIDDDSTDKTEEIIKIMIGEPNNKEDFIYKKVNGKDVIYKKNKFRIRSGMGNYRVATRDLIEDGMTVCCPVDGDDWLKTENAISKLADFYNDDLWVVWSQFEQTNGQKGFSNHLDKDYNIRSWNWVTSHLRTYRKFLFDKVKDEDLKDENGNYYTAGWDLAMMYPMLEMAGPKRRAFFDEVLYVYNMHNPISDHRVNGGEQSRVARKMINSEPYEELP